MVPERLRQGSLLCISERDGERERLRQGGGGVGRITLVKRLVSIQFLMERGGNLG